MLKFFKKSWRYNYWDNTEYLTGPDTLWIQPCLDHNHDSMKPQVVSTYLPDTVGGAPESSVVFAETQVSPFFIAHFVHIGL